MFTAADLELVRWTVGRFPGLSRWELALTICENLPWKAPNGRARVHECLPLLEGLAAAGMVSLPEKRAPRPARVARARAQPLPPLELAASLRALRPITVEPVPASERAVWDATVAQQHALGFRGAFGAHQRYWICGVHAGRPVVLGALLFAAAARHVAVRDAWLGWTAQQRQRFRARIVANSRFLIRTGVCVPHLASHALALALRRLPSDWRRQFGYAPVVVETYVVAPWRGTCYRAANWVHLGHTTGQGRQDRRYAQGGTVREVFVRPLVPDWRQALVAEAARLPGGDEGMLTAEQALNEKAEKRIQARYALVAQFLDEKQRRLLAGAEAIAYGSGGQKRVATLLSLSAETVARGMRELRDPGSVEPERVRQPGGGRKPAADSDPTLLSDLDALVSPSTRGDPESPLRWTAKSTANLAQELSAMKEGRSIGARTVAKLLHEAGYSLQATRKTREGTEHPDRDAQFRHIHDRVLDYQSRGQPIISVDTKKKELVGDFKNAGREWQPKGQPETVRIHDFLLPELGKVSPYGVYDPTRNEGWVNVGTDHDTAAFAVASIRGWWRSMGQEAYPHATALLITADGGGSNNSRSRLWKVELQKLADELGLSIAVSHFPPGTSKWNKVEHRLFSHITQNWRGRPLTSHETIVQLIANTTTATGLTVRCNLDTNAYPVGVQVSDAELDAVQLERSDFHGDWNYTVIPTKRS
jgi:transposase